MPLARYMDSPYVARASSRLDSGLSDNGSCYRAHDTIDFADRLGLVPCFTPVRSRMAEAFVKTFKRDYEALHKQRLTPDKAEMLEDVVTAKLGLALSAFGTIVWGWGKYLGWWSFTLMLVWTLFAVRDVKALAAYLSSL